MENHHFTKKNIIIVAIILIIIILGVDSIVGYSIGKNQSSAKDSKLENKITSLQTKNKHIMNTLNNLLFFTDQQKLLVAIMENPVSIKAALKGVNNQSSTGVAYVLRADGKLALTLSTTLSGPKKDTYFEAWIANKDANPQIYLDAGRLIKQTNGLFSASYQWEKGYDGANFIFVTEESKSRITNPGNHLLEGSL